MGWCGSFPSRSAPFPARAGPSSAGKGRYGVSTPFGSTAPTHGPESVRPEAQVSKYRAQLDRMEQHALSPTDSRGFVQDIANRR